MDSEAFVRWAYVTMLGRPVDPEGLAFYLRRMDEGKSKISVLKQLKLSAEGRVFDAQLQGLDSAIQQEKLERIPVIGPIYRWFQTQSEARTLPGAL
ncbi:hypothetical protein SSCI18S_03892 [Sphingobium scionense]|uniref:DUF4214 domain-containing protein n=2 Tax=Sphingobium scionense TaxID=1404341 RepID=A0A7W6LNZ5_9SPHN|nr:hypothetical protein [Sphingobium scionense]